MVASFPSRQTHAFIYTFFNIKKCESESAKYVKQAFLINKKQKD